MMTLTEKALRLATAAHKDQVRKSDGSPYITHPVMVGVLLKEYGFSEAVVAAGFTHDVLEDTSVTREELAAKLGEDVAVMVDGVSEDKDLSWEARKERYVAGVVAAGEGVRAVSIADKIHNAESILNDYEHKGRAVWNVFNRGKAKKLWFEELLYTELKKDWEHPLLERYGRLIEQLKGLEE
ncbi:MAG: bifunctional (p)ppGpp synthetase/guanosine-3',5'-bis(diphosphate) 3'-pyrophosphohydrolase [Candidatus Nomurabacteria bacterium]|nr:MAG: bifunctional (p)ppGpp synthetase/guanosine-3',5'-bis(diphosphate) 3'-pyrophosphohydrolase [Candidatus Nomurabacteria bacterium]